MAAMNYSYNKDLNLVMLRPIGIVSVQNILSYGQELLDKGYMTHRTIEYVDMSEIEDLSIFYTDSLSLASMHNKWIEAGWFGSYYYAPRDIHMGIVNMVASVVKSQPCNNLPEDIMLPLRERIEPEDVREYIQKRRADRLQFYYS